MSEYKVIVIGLDGATWNLIKPWADSGNLPTLKKLMNEGIWGFLESPFPVTIPAWACYSTGKNPGKFGVYDWIKVDLKNRKIKTVNYRDFKSKDIWDYLNEYGIKTGIINIPHTYPPKKVDGYMISGMLASEISNYTYPRSLKSELDELGYRIHPKYPLHMVNEVSMRDKYVKDIIDLVKLRFEIAKMNIEDVDFLHITIFYIDYLQHFLWNSTRVLDVWKVIDMELNRFLSELESKNIKFTLILMSDHGFAKLKSGLGFYLNALLAKAGLLKTKNIYFYQFLYKLGIRFEELAELARKVKLYEFGRMYFRKLSRLVPARDGEFLHEGLETVINWDESIAVNLGGIIGQIYLLQDYNEILSILKKVLLKINDPITNEPIISGIYQKSEIIWGDYSSDAPDIFVFPNSGYVIGRFNISGHIFEKSVWKASHTKQGVFLLYGENVGRLSTATKTPKISIYDLAPTILYLFNVQVPDDMDGNILVNFLNDDFNRKYKPIRKLSKKYRIRETIKTKFSRKSHES